MCFNIAEAINIGWVTGQNSATWYNNGINASLSNYGLTNGQVLTAASSAAAGVQWTTISTVPYA